MMHSAPWGVWATPDSEIVITPKVLLVYQRSPEMLSAFAYQRHGSDYQLLAISASYWGRNWCAVSFGSDGHSSTNGNRDGALHLLDTAKRSVPLDLLDPPRFPWLGGAVSPVLVESIRISDPFPGPQASPNNVGRCLSIWPIGTTLFRNNDSLSSFSLLVNTARNWCIFEKWDHEDGLSIYCRCARVAFSNLGMVFIQNVKMSVFDPKNVNQCFMSKDNLAAAQATIEVDPAKFDSDQCAFIGPEGREWATIYWSVNQVTADQITLHGCEGKEYVHNRPTGAAQEKIEYFMPPDPLQP